MGSQLSPKYTVHKKNRRGTYPGLRAPRGTRIWSLLCPYPALISWDWVSYASRLHLTKLVYQTTAANSTNLGSIVIFASCVLHRSRIGATGCNKPIWPFWGPECSYLGLYLTGVPTAYLDYTESSIASPVCIVDIHIIIIDTPYSLFFVVIEVKMNTIT